MRKFLQENATAVAVTSSILTVLPREMLFLKNMILTTFTSGSSKDMVLMMVVLAVMVSLMLFLSLLKIVMMTLSDVFTVVCIVFSL